MLNCSFSDFESQYFSKQKATSLEKIHFIPSKFFAISSAQKSQTTLVRAAGAAGGTAGGPGWHPAQPPAGVCPEAWGQVRGGEDQRAGLQPGKGR